MKRKLNIFDDYNEVYDEVGVGIRQCNDLVEAKFFASLISLPKSSKVLDVGCAEGILSVILAKMGYDVTAVDISPKMIAHTKILAEAECVKLTTEVCDIEDRNNIKLRNGPFDAVYLMDTMEHLRSPITALINIHSMLNQEGLLIINTPNIMTPSSFLRAIYFHHAIKHFGVGELRDFHLQSYSHDSLTQTLALAGFEVTTYVPGQVDIPRTRAPSKRLSQWFPKLSRNILLISKKADFLDLNDHLDGWRRESKH